MIRSLRWRLVAVTMLLLSLVLFLCMYLFFSSTYRGMEEDSLNALHLAGMRYGLHGVHEGEEPTDPPPPDRDGDGKGPEDGVPDLLPPDREDGKGPDGDKPGGEKSSIPCFVVGYDHDAQLYAEGPGYYDMTDETYLEQIVAEAAETGKSHGILLEEKLRFLKLDDICGEAYAFTDVSNEQAALVRLMYQYLLIGLLAILGFFLISMLTSKWAVRPIETVMQQQRQFVGDASHELKTPLTVILTNAELLSSEEYPREAERKFTANILTMAGQMRGLVEELLDLARADNGLQTMERQPLDLSRLVSDGVLPFEPMYYEAGRTLLVNVEPGIRVLGNADALTRVVDILLDNGCKYSLEGSSVTLELKRCGVRSCQLTVTSQGDTLTRQECRDIFKRFYRRDPSRSMNHSYGLGLSIARTIITRHKGKIWLSSKQCTNTFHVFLKTVPG